MNQSMEVTGTKFKYQETTKQIKMQFFKPDGTSYYPDSSHNFQAKVANSTGIVGTYPVVVQGSNIILSTSKLTELPPDDYQMEVWETYTDDAGPETTIYPSPDACIYFTIEDNIDGKSGTVIKELGFQDVVNQAVEQAGLNLVVSVESGEPGTQATVKQEYDDGKNNLTFVIPKGEKGDPGSLANATIDGRNFFLNSRLYTGQNMASQYVTVTFEDFDANTKMMHFTGPQSTSMWSAGVYISDNQLSEHSQNGDHWAFSADMRGTGTLSKLYRENSTQDYDHDMTLTDSWQRLSQTGTLVDSTSGAWCIYFDATKGPVDAYIKLIKVERNATVASGWSPAPEDILTQSDYAKIQAAIVALGGSL